MTVPEVRDRLYQLADILGSTELHRLADNLWRRKPGRRKAPVSAQHLSPELAAAIREYAGNNPKMTEHQISILFGVNQGRVSEALFGHRK